jgi:Entner-Doudoroff aldolase
MSTNDATAMQKVLDAIEATRVVAIMRGDFRGHEKEVVEVLFDAGIRAVEVTLNSPAALSAIEFLAARFGSNMAIGAGTVLKPGEVEQAASAGARFIVSPNRDVRVIETTKRFDLVSIPGCFTPSEIVEAMHAGADATKIFPANLLGPAFVRAMLGPLSDMRMVPTGGVTPEIANEYISAGAWAVGVGSELISEDALLPRGLDALRERAAAFVAAVAG